MSRYRNLIALLLGLSLLVFLTTAVIAQDERPVSDDEVNEIARELYCPICENVPLDVCPTQACEDWRELIREYISKGWSAEEIKDYFSAQYGWNVLSVPPRTGLNWIIYIIPPFIFVGGLVIIIVLIRKGKRNQQLLNANLGELDVPVTDVFLDRVDRDLKGEDQDG